MECGSPSSGGWASIYLGKFSALKVSLIVSRTPDDIYCAGFMTAHAEPYMLLVICEIFSSGIHLTIQVDLTESVISLELSFDGVLCFYHCHLHSWKSM